MKIGTGDLTAPRRVLLREGRSASFETRALIGMVFNAVHKSAWPATHCPSAERTPDAVLRTLLTFCYATGVVSSEEVALAARQDRAVRYLCANHWPTWEEIRDFRRRNACGLKESLSELFRAAGPGAPAPLTGSVLAAEDRLRHAMQADSMALDF